MKLLLDDLPKIEETAAEYKELIKAGVASRIFARRRQPITLDRIRRYHEDTQKRFDLETTLPDKNEKYSEIEWR